MFRTAQRARGVIRIATGLEQVFNVTIEGANQNMKRIAMRIADALVPLVVQLDEA